MAKPGPSRGWNDPPPMAYSSSSGSSSGYRLGHPLSRRPRQQPAAAESFPTTMLFTPGVPGNSATVPDSADGQSPAHSPAGLQGNSPPREHRESQSEEPLPSVEVQVERMVKIVGDRSASCAGCMVAKAGQDMQSRVKLFLSALESGKLSDKVRERMFRLCVALEKHNIETAKTLQVAIMVDHVAEVSQWMVGIKHLISQVEKLPEEER